VPFSCGADCGILVSVKTAMAVAAIGSFGVKLLVSVYISGMRDYTYLKDNRSTAMSKNTRR
jgi:hypothetical protein